MKMFSYRNITLAFAIVVIFTGVSMAATGDFLNAVVKEQSLLLEDSTPDSNQLGYLEPGNKLAVFPEMSTDNYFFVMASSGPCEYTYGWVPARTITFSDDKYPDVPKDHWAREAIRELDDEGIMIGDEDGFDGDRPVTRYELATTLDRHLKRFKAYKDSVQRALEAIPADTVLSGQQAARMDRLIHHLEGIELTENSLKLSYANLEKRINNNEQRMDVVEEMAMNNSELLAKVDSKVSGLSSTANDVSKIRADLKNVMGRLKKLESSTGGSSTVQAYDDSAIRQQLEQLRARVIELESSREMTLARVTPTPVVDDAEEVDFSIDGFDDGDTDEIPVLENPHQGLSQKVTDSHSALRAALSKGLVIRRHPLDDRAVNTESEKHVPSEPNRFLVRALTKQIAEISSSLSSVGERIENIERGVL